MSRSLNQQGSLRTPPENGTYVGKTDPGVPHFFVTKKGDDANDGRSWGSAKATLEGALVALAAVTGLQKPYWVTNSGIIDMGYGLWNTDGNIQLPYGVLLRGAGAGNTTLKLNAARNCNVIQTAAWGKTGVNDIDDYIKIEQLQIDGNASAQTAAVYESVVTANTTLSTTVPIDLPVASTAGMPATGRLWAGGMSATYTGTTATSFTGVLKISGENSTLFPLARVIPLNMQGHGIALQATRCIIEDVSVGNVIGSGFAVQSNGVSSPGIAYENKFIRCRSGGNRYGWELGEGATDGTIAFSSGGGGMGALIVCGVNWHITDFHPVGGGLSSGKVATRAQITICSGMQFFTGLYLDTAKHDGIVFDTQKRQIAIYNVDLDVESLYGSAAGGGSSLIRALGNFSTWSVPKITNIRARVRNGDGNVGLIFSNGPKIRTVSVGTQNLVASGKLQVNDVSSFPATGGSVTLLSGLTYTGVQVTETETTGGIDTGTTTLTAKVLGNLDPSGCVVVVGPTNRMGQVISYTGITMSGNNAILTGIPASGPGSVSSAMSGGAYLTQHFLTGVTSSETAVANGLIGLASQYANWEVSNFNLDYQTGTLVPAGDPFQIPATGPTTIAALDLANGANRHVRVDGLATPKSAVGTWALNQNVSAYYGGYTQNNVGTALNDSLTFTEVWLDAGTWSLDLFGFTGADGGIVTASLQGIRGRNVAITGTQDQYFASAVSKRDTFTGIAIPVSGLYSVVVKVTDKNASSTNYRARISGAVLGRTA